MSSLQASARPDCGGQRRIGVEGKSKYCLRWKLLKTGGESKASRSIGRTYQDDSERSSRRKANEAETGWSQPAHKLQTRPSGKGPRCAKFLCRIWYLCWNLTT